MRNYVHYELRIKKKDRPYFFLIWAVFFFTALTTYNGIAASVVFKGSEKVI